MTLHYATGSANTIDNMTILVSVDPAPFVKYLVAGIFSGVILTLLIMWGLYVVTK